jgi:hypothetical protein
MEEEEREKVAWGNLVQSQSREHEIFQKDGQIAAIRPRMKIVVFTSLNPSGTPDLGETIQSDV